MDFALYTSIITGIMGLFVGSFLNVFLERAPMGKSLGGRSHCDHCGRTLTFLELIPVLSHIIQGGKSTCCKKKLSLRYSIIEAGLGISFFAVSYLFLLKYGFFTLAPLALGALLLAVVVTFIIIYFDIREFVIYDSLQLLLFLSVLLYLSFNFFFSVHEAIGSVVFAIFLYFLFEKVADRRPIAYLMACVVFVIAFLFGIFEVARHIPILEYEAQRVLPFIFDLGRFAKTYPLLARTLSAPVGALPLLIIYAITKGRGMGFGDVKLQFTLSLFLGLTASLVGLYVSFLIGAILGGVLMVLKKANRKTRIPFGPFLLIGAWTACIAQLLGILR